MLKRILTHQRHKVISFLLLGLLVCGGHLPYLAESLLFYTALFGAALLSYARNTVLNALLAMSTLAYALAWANAFHDVVFDVLFGVSALICLYYVVHSTIRYVLKCRQVKLEEIFALINCYFIMGYFWAMLYTMVEGFTPGAFTIPVRLERTIDSFIYYSFITMTTVGFGDMAPVSVLAQRLSVTQAIFGQFYFALVVAYLLNRLFQTRQSAAERQTP